LGLGRSGTTPTAGLDDAALTLSAPGLDEALSAPGFDEPGTALAALGRDLGARFDALTTAPGGSAGGEVGLGGDAIARQGRRLDDLTLVDPDLDADRPDGRVGGGGAEVDVGAQGVERNPAFAVPLAASHLGATEAALGFDSHAFGARLHGGGDGTLHRPAERDPVLELIGDAPGQQRGVEVGILDFVDVELHGTSREVLEPGPQALGLGAASADHHAGSGGVDVDDQTVTGALDVDA